MVKEDNDNKLLSKEWIYILRMCVRATFVCKCTQKYKYMYTSVQMFLVLSLQLEFKIISKQKV